MKHIHLSLENDRKIKSFAKAKDIKGQTKQTQTPLLVVRRKSKTQKEEDAGKDQEYAPINSTAVEKRAKNLDIEALLETPRQIL